MINPYHKVVGRFFEGTGSDMHDALSVILTLPLETRVYCGHE